jgi:DNA-binding FadR family transcriptional regulator
MITESIISRTLKPGDKLPTEFEFAELLGVGRNSVREAIKMLSSLGVIEVKRGAGTFIVEEISSSMLNPLILSLAFEQGTSKDLIEFRILIENSVAELVIEKASDEDIARLEEANKALKEAADRNIDDSHVLRDLDLNVHSVLFEITGNPLIAKIAHTIYTLFYASIEKSVKINPKHAYRGHQLWIEAIKNRNYKLYKEKFNETLSIWKEYVNR